MKPVSYVMEVKAPIEKVFFLVGNDEMHKKWMEGLEETVYLNKLDRENPLGTKFKQKMKEAGRVQEYVGEVIAYEKPQLIGVKIYHKFFTAEVYYRLANCGDSTMLNYSVNMKKGHSATKVFGLLIHGLTKKILKKHMMKLKMLAESHPIGERPYHK
jgi:hypothetical protein